MINQQDNQQINLQSLNPSNKIKQHRKKKSNISELKKNYKQYEKIHRNSLRFSPLLGQAKSLKLPLKLQENNAKKQKKQKKKTKTKTKIRFNKKHSMNSK